MSIPVGVIGATGFVGGELLRLLSGHPEFELVYISASDRSTGSDGVPVAAIHPNLRGGESATSPDADMRVVGTVSSQAAQQCAAVFLATPPEVSVALAPVLLAAGVQAVVDLSPAFRLVDEDAHERWYPQVRRPSGLTAAYGLPEYSRATLSDARLIAVPGCLATAAILAMLPLCALPGVRFASIVIDGKSGSTGSGGKMRASSLHAVRSGVIAPYAPIDHRHSAEIRQAMLARGLPTGPRGLRLGMSVFSVDLVRGLSVAVHAMVDSGDARPAPLDPAIHFRGFFRDEYFVRVRDWQSEAVPLPDPKAVIGSNYCDIAAFHDPDADRLVVVAALDNLMKGAAGQAVQACNIRFGLPEHLGLAALPVYPI